MKTVSTLLVLLTLAVTNCKKEYNKEDAALAGKRCTSTAAHPMKDSVQAIINRYIAKGIPGIQVTVKNNNGWLFSAGGVSQMEKATNLPPCATSWIFSITKTYTAALVLKAKEKGLINLDHLMAQYLPQQMAAHLAGSDKITVRMLLSHTTGLVDHTTVPEFLERQFADPAHQPTLEEDLAMIYDKPLLFEPGSDFSYCNTNYLLLQVILEKVTGKKYEQLLRSEILQPLGLQNTYYGASDGQLKNGDFPNYYFDPNANGQLQNGTDWNNYLGNASYAYGGLAATPADVILYYEALVQGHVVSAASLQEMKTWVQGKESTQPDYGLGLEYYQYAPGSTGQYGHEGDGIANSTLVLYVPDNNTFLYVNCTVGRKLGGPFLYKVTDFKNEISTYIARWR